MEFSQEMELMGVRERGTLLVRKAWVALEQSLTSDKVSKEI